MQYIDIFAAFLVFSLYNKQSNDKKGELMRQVVLFGTGHQAEKFVYGHEKQYDIMYVLDFSGGGVKSS